MRRKGILYLLWSLIFLASALTLGQGRRGQSRRSDTSPIELPGGARVEFVEMESPALGGRGEYSVYLPPSYGDRDQQYPVVYFLHGMFNDHTTWTLPRHGDLPAMLERLMLDNKLPEMILIHPNGGQSFYTNTHDGSLKYEDFVVKELPSHVETKYRIRKGRPYRSLAGTSMGGFGALKIAMKHQGLYSAVAAHSPIIFPFRNPLELPPELKSSRRFSFFNDIFSSIYGNPVDQDYYDANNPLVLAKDCPKDLAIYFDYGTDDRYIPLVQLDKGIAMLDKALTEAGVAHTFRKHEGEPHGWALVSAHIEESLGFIAAAASGAR